MEIRCRRPALGDLLRDWRRRRRMSQLDLALEADVSARHLSFVESGRAAPSRAMILRLALALDVPLRERNVLLAAGGFAPVFPDHRLEGPELARAMAAVTRIVDGHAPFPALAVDARWTLLRANGPALGLMAGVAAALAEPPVNVLRLSLHPDGLAPRIVNFAEWRAHVLERLKRQVARSGDVELAALREELRRYPAPRGLVPHPAAGATFDGIATPLRLATGDRILSFIATTTVFGTALEVSLEGVVIESFFPADEATALALGAAPCPAPEDRRSAR